MVFDIKNKVALITGGGSGIGLRYAEELLKHGAKGVVLADISKAVGEEAEKNLQVEFGKGKAVFVKTDVTDIKQVENAFKKTIEVYNQIDILFNNAGIMDDSVWEKEIAINLNGTIYGILLGLENYLQKYKSGDEAVILNIASIAATHPYHFIPIYSATKLAIIGLTQAWGDIAHYNRTKVRMVALAPGVTNTPLISESTGKNLGPEYQKLADDVFAKMEGLSTQTPEQMAQGAIKVLQKAPTATTWVVEGGEEPYQYILPERSAMTQKVFLE